MKRVIVVLFAAACGAPATPHPAPARPASATQTPSPAPAEPQSVGARPTPTERTDSDAQPAHGDAPDAADATATPLKSRAHPFAVYVVRMHRKLHPHWGVAYLGSLADKPANDPLGDLSLAVTVELAIDAQGALVDARVVKASRQQVFDDAAVEAFQAAAPFDVPPDAIRGTDGRVHLRWTLYRDDRECGTYGVEPLLD